MVFSFASIALANGQAGTTLSAEKTAQGFKGTVIEYNWAIEKDVSPSNIEISQGESETVTYTLTATRTQVGSTEGAGVEGQICVENGGDQATENLTINDVVQTKVGPGQFQDYVSNPVDISAKPILGAGEDHCYPYTVTFSPVEDALYKNIARVTITNHSGHLGTPFGPGYNSPQQGVAADFTLPSESGTSYIDAEADITDVEDNISGLTYNLINTGNGTGPWHLNDSGVISFDKEITNESLCGEDIDFGNTVGLVESDTQELRTDSTLVEIGTGECSQEDLCTNLKGNQTEIPQGYEDPDQNKVCTEITQPTPTPTPSSGGQTNIRKPKISPQVLGTQAPVEGEALPVSGADINYDWVYYFLIIASLMTTYYLKVRGWQKIRA